MGKIFKVLVNVFLLCLLSQGVWALVFTAKDNAFTIDLPSTWSKVETPDYLFLQNKSGATMRFVTIKDCFDRQCLESIVEKEVKDLTKRNFKIIKDEYSGEFIRETEFSTGDPLFSFDFTKQNLLFTAGYFLSGGKAYNVGVRGIPYTEASYLLSFISPVPKEEIDQMQEATLSGQAAPLEDIEQSDLLNTEAASNAIEEKPKIQAGKQENLQPLKISKKLLKSIILIFGLYLMLWLGSFVYKTFFPSKLAQGNSNPNSPYPLQGKRLYGSPDLFLRLHDNLGNHFIATCTRWGGLFVISGLSIVLFFVLVRLILTVLVAKIAHPSLIINTCYSLSYLFTACGFIIFIAGVVLNWVFPYKFLFYDSEGQLAYKCLQKGWHFLYEQYFVVGKNGEVLYKLTRKNFSFLRNWRIFDADKEIAHIKEHGFVKSFFRHIFGHLFGFLRASYIIKAQRDSSGEIKSISSPATQFSSFLDKPQALSEDVMLVFNGVLFMRDRDKSFPWIN